MHTTPPSLLERLRHPCDPDSWSRFVHLYTPLLLGWGHRLGLCAVDAADLTQEVFLVLVRRLPEFRYNPDGSFRAWLRTVLINKWRELAARRREQPLGAESPALSGLAVADPVELFTDAEYRDFLSRRALRLIQREFQPTTWKAFWESVVAGRPTPEVARELGVSANAVYLARSRVLHRLREELKGLLD